MTVNADQRIDRIAAYLADTGFDKDSMFLIAVANFFTVMHENRFSIETLPGEGRAFARALEELPAHPTIRLDVYREVLVDMTTLLDEIHTSLNEVHNASRT